jgi:Ca2+-transporting ATPase
VPFLQPIFNTYALNLLDWLEIIPLIALPTVFGEITKLFIKHPSERKVQTALAAAGD